MFFKKFISGVALLRGISFVSAACLYFGSFSPCEAMRSPKKQGALGLFGTTTPKPKLPEGEASLEIEKALLARNGERIAAAIPLYEAAANKAAQNIGVGDNRIWLKCSIEALVAFAKEGHCSAKTALANLAESGISSAKDAIASLDANGICTAE
jgi:hypothetical protein